MKHATEHSLKPGQNPRDVLSNHEDRGLQRNHYTYDDLAEICGVKVASMQADRSVRVADLRSVAVRIVRALRAQSKALTPADLRKLWGSDTLAAEWEARYPPVDLYWCGYPACTAVRVGPGLCVDHGGDRFPGLDLTPAGYMRLRTGERYTPLHRLLVPAAGMDVHHVDGNRWNNHPTNLNPMPHATHWAVHQPEPNAPADPVLVEHLRYVGCPPFCRVGRLVEGGLPARILPVLRADPQRVWSMPELAMHLNESELRVSGACGMLHHRRTVVVFNGRLESAADGMVRALHVPPGRHIAEQHQYMEGLPGYLIAHGDALGLSGLWAETLRQWAWKLATKTLGWTRLDRMNVAVDVLDATLPNPRLRWWPEHADLPSWDAVVWPWQQPGKGITGWKRNT